MVSSELDEVWVAWKARVGCAQWVVDKGQEEGAWGGGVKNLLMIGLRQMRSIVFRERMLGPPPSLLGRSRLRRKRQLPAIIEELTSSLSPWCERIAGGLGWV